MTQQSACARACPSGSYVCLWIEWTLTLFAREATGQREKSMTYRPHRVNNVTCIHPVVKYNKVERARRSSHFSLQTFALLPGTTLQSSLPQDLISHISSITNEEESVVIRTTEPLTNPRPLVTRESCLHFEVRRLVPAAVLIHPPNPKAHLWPAFIIPTAPYPHATFYLDIL